MFCQSFRLSEMAAGHSFGLTNGCMGLSLSVLAPALWKHVQKRALKQRTVQEALTDGTWIQDIRGDLSGEALLEYVQLWEILSVVNLPVGIEWGSTHLVTNAIIFIERDHNQDSLSSLLRGCWFWTMEGNLENLGMRVLKTSVVSCVLLG